MPRSAKPKKEKTPRGRNEPVFTEGFVLFLLAGLLVGLGALCLQVASVRPTAQESLAEIYCLASGTQLMDDERARHMFYDAYAALLDIPDVDAVTDGRLAALLAERLDLLPSGWYCSWAMVSTHAWRALGALLLAAAVGLPAEYLFLRRPREDPSRNRTARP